MPPGAAVAEPAEAPPGEPAAQGTQIRARGYWEGIWLRLKQDKLALAGGVFVILLFLVAFIGAPIAKHFLGHGPNDLFINGGGIDEDLLPVGPWSHVTNPTTGAKQLFILGSDGTLARDEFLRILYGAQVSLEVAFGATFLCCSSA